MAMSARAVARQEHNLHFSVIVSGQFVDPAPYVSEKGGNSVLAGESLVAFRSGNRTCARPPPIARAAVCLDGSAACRVRGARRAPSRGAAILHDAQPRPPLIGHTRPTGAVARARLIA